MRSFSAEAGDEHGVAVGVPRQDLKRPFRPLAGQRIVEGLEGEVRIVFLEPFDDVLVLAAEDRAGGVDEDAAGTDAGAGVLEDLLLQVGHVGDALDGRRPARVGVPPPRPRAGAGGVDQRAVEAFLFPAAQAFAVPWLADDVGERGAARPDP